MLILKFLILAPFFHIFHSDIIRTPKELQRAMINTAPWSRCKHYRFDPEFRSLVFELLCVQQSLEISMDDMEGIVKARSMVRKYKIVKEEDEFVQDEEDDEDERREKQHSL